METAQDIKTLKNDLSKKLDLFNKIRFGDSYKIQPEIDNNEVTKLIIEDEEKVINLKKEKTVENVKNIDINTENTSEEINEIKEETGEEVKEIDEIKENTEEKTKSVDTKTENTSEEKKVIKMNSTTSKFGTSFFGRTRRR